MCTMNVIRNTWTWTSQFKANKKTKPWILAFSIQHDSVEFTRLKYTSPKIDFFLVNQTVVPWKKMDIFRLFFFTSLHAHIRLSQNFGRCVYAYTGQIHCPFNVYFLWPKCIHVHINDGIIEPWWKIYWIVVDDNFFGEGGEVEINILFWIYSPNRNNYGFSFRLDRKNAHNHNWLEKGWICHWLVVTHSKCRDIFLAIRW